KVTISGQSAGSGSSCIHTVSPQSKGLFRGAIEMSGDCLMTPSPTLKESESQGDTFAASVGCPGTDAQAAACLRQKPADDLLKAGGGGSTGGATAIPLRPIVDGNIVPDQPKKLVESGKWAKVPVVVSNTADEATVTVLLQTQQQGSSF